MSGECAYPNCPSAQNVKIADDRHNEVKGHLERIEGGQDRIISLAVNVATLTAEVSNIKATLTMNQTDHNEMYTRLRSVEGKVVYLTGGVAGIVAVIEILRGIGVIK